MQKIGSDVVDSGAWRRIRRALHLSSRELQVVQHIFDGGRLITIAADMDLKLGTVKTYLRRIYSKLGVSNQRELVLAVMAEHLRPTDSVDSTHTA